MHDFSNNVLSTIDSLCALLETYQVESFNEKSILDLRIVKRELRKLRASCSSFVSFKSLTLRNDLDSLIELWGDFEEFISEKKPKDIAKLSFDTIIFLKKYRSMILKRNYPLKEETINDNINIRIKSPEEEQSRLEDLSKRRLELIQQYKIAKEESPQNEKKIQDIEEKLERLGADFLDKKRVIKNLRTESADEQYMIKRLENALKDISTDSHLDDELKKLRNEYCALTWVLIVLVLLFLLCYGYFLYSLSVLKFEDWCDYLPYTMSVPIFAALLWLFVYLKNRASKLSIELSSKLYHIHYLEGLMKIIVSVSKTNEDALVRIDTIVNSIVDSFVKTISQSAQNSEQVSSIEKLELKDTPYWKVVSELKEIIKLIKHE